MESRLNKLISDSGLCSRREADKFIEMGRVTVNGQQPTIGQKVTESDLILVDGERIHDGKYTGNQSIRAVSGKAKELVLGDNRQVKSPKEPKSPKELKSPQAPRAEKEPRFEKGQKPRKAAKATLSDNSDEEVSISKRPAKFGKYNKYAAARKAEQNGEKPKSKSKPEKEAIIEDALRPKFGKSLSRSAVAQRMASYPKSASLRKTSKNNPANKAKRTASRNKPQEE